MTDNLSHFDSNGNARMVDVGHKPVSRRTARAAGFIKVKRDTVAAIESGTKKGDVLGTARLAGIMASKQTSNLIPLCHNIPIDSVEIHFSISEHDSLYSDVQIEAIVHSTGYTGVEMEALTAVTVSALTVYDMCKSIDREMEIHNVMLVSKTGGTSGDFVRPDKNEVA